MNQSRTAGRNRSWWLFTASNYGRVVILALTAPLIARSLGPSGRGLYALAVAADGISTQLLSFGLPQATGYLRRHDGVPAEEALSRANSFLGWSVFASVVGGVVVFLWSAGTFNGADQFAPLLLIVTTPITLYSNTLATLSSAGGNYRFLALQPMLPITVQAGYIITAAVTPVPLTIIGAITALVVGRIVTGIVLHLRVPFSHLRRAKRRDRAMLRYGLRTMPGTFGQVAYAQADQLVIFALLGQRALGVYAVGVTVASVVYPLGISLATRIFYDPSTGDDMASRQVLAREAVLMVGCFAGCVAAVAPVIVPVAFGSRFADAQSVTQILCVGIALYGYYLACRSLLDSVGLPKRASVAQISSVVLMIPFVWAAGRWWGLPGAAAGSVLAGLVRAVLMSVFCRRAGLQPPVPRPGDARIIVRRLIDLPRARRARTARAGAVG